MKKLALLAAFGFAVTSCALKEDKSPADLAAEKKAKEVMNAKVRASDSLLLQKNGFKLVGLQGKWVGAGSTYTAEKIPDNGLTYTARVGSHVAPGSTVTSYIYEIKTIETLAPKGP